MSSPSPASISCRGALKSNSGISFVTLKDWSRAQGPGQDARNLAPALGALNANFRDGVVIGFNPPPIQGISVTGGFEFFLQDRSGGPLDRAVGGGQQGRGRRPTSGPSCAACPPPSRTAVPQYRTDVDREKARALGIPINTIFETMQSSFGSLYVNDFSLFGRTYRVSLSSEADFREKPDDLRHVFVRSDSGAMVPLNELVTVHPHPRSRHGRSLQHLPGRQDPRQPGAGLFVGPGDRGHAAGRGRRRCSSDYTHRLDRIGLPGAGDGRHGLAGLRLRPRHGVPDPGGAVRALVAAARRAHRGAVRRPGRPGRHLAARPGERRLLPDRAGDADRPCRQERHPDRRVRLAAPSTGAVRSTTPPWRPRGCASGRSS